METPVCLLQYFQQHTSLPPSEIRQVCSCFKKISLGRNEYYQKEGTPVRQIAYLAQGIMRVYTMDEKGNEAVLHFVTEDCFIISQDGYCPGKPCSATVQAITECELWTLSTRDIECLKQQVPECELAIWQISDHTLSGIIENLSLLRTGAPTDQYRTLLSQIPDIGMYVPLKDIASYLGITQPSLSRIRRHIV